MNKLYFLIAMSLTGMQSIFPQGVWHNYTLSNSNIPFESVGSMAVDHQDNVWIGNDNSGNYQHIARFDGNSFAGAFQNGWVDDITVDDANNVWSTVMGELQKWNGTAWSSYTLPISGFWLFPIEADAGGNIWIFDYVDEALYLFNGTTTTQITTAMGLPSNKVISMAHSPGGMYIGTADAGLGFYNGSTFTVYNTSNSMLTSNNILDMTWKDDTLFMSLINNDLAYLHNGIIELIHDGNLRYGRLGVDSHGNIWIAAYGFGIIKYSLNGNFSMYNLIDPFNQYNCIEVDAADHVWVGTQQAGLAEFTPSGTAGFEGIEKGKTSIQLCPVPADVSSVFRIQMPREAEAELNIYDALGRKVINVFTGTLPGGITNIPLPQAKLPAGLYFYRLVADDQMITNKFLVQ